MAGPRTRCSLRRNLPPGGENELAGGLPGAPTKGSNTPTPSPPASRAQTPASAQASAPPSNEGLFQQFMKAYLENQNQNQAPPPTPIQAELREQPLKAQFPDLYYGNSHLDCYRFCQQCEDHFDTAGASGPNRIPFAASFLRGSVIQRWHQHKRRAEGAPMTWAEFKDFLRKNLGDDRAFANSICSKFRRDSQYQAESVLDWAAHLEHLQSILLEYDSVGAPTEPTMLRYFREGLKSSILPKLEHWDLELESFDQMVKKAVNAEAKSALHPRSSTKEMDQHCPWGNQPANSTKSQGSTMKDLRSEEPKDQGTESLGSQQSEPSEKDRKEKKKKWQKDRQEKKEKKAKDTMPATGNNAINTARG